MDKITAKISSTLKSIRKASGWSLDLASQKTGVSKAMLGQIERGESSPTIATLWKIASGFDVSFSSFIEGLKPTSIGDDKIRVTPIFPYDKELAFETFIIELAPGYEHISQSHQSGVIEHVVVSRGEIEVSINGTWHTLKENEGLRFNAAQPHGYRNITGMGAAFYNMIHYASSKTAYHQKITRL